MKQKSKIDKYIEHYPIKRKITIKHYPLGYDTIRKYQNYKLRKNEIKKFNYKRT